MRTPTLRQVEDDLARIGSMAPKLAEAARWAWPMAYSPRRSGGERVAGGSVSTPVEAAVASAVAGSVRDDVGRAGVLVGRAVQLLELANGCLARAQDTADGRPPAQDESPGPPMVSRGELASARKAKAKRDAARPPGTGHGEY